MAFNSDIRIGPVKVKDALGALGLAGDATAVYSLFSGRLAVSIGIVSLLFLLIWGALSRNSDPPFLKVLARVTTLAAAAGLAFVATVVTLLLLSEPPSALGEVAQVEVEEFTLTGARPAERVTGPFSPKFKRSADVAEVGIMPAPEESGRVEEVRVRGVGGSEEQTGRMSEILNKRSPSQVFYLVDRPAPDFKVVLHLDVRLKQVGPPPALKLRAHYTYAQRNWSWKVKRWVFENIGERWR